MSSVPSVTLATGDRVAGRQFTDPEATVHDLAALAAMRAAQRARIEAQGGDGTWNDEDGATHWLVAPRPELLLRPEPCLAVGFFGQARDDVDHGVIISLEHAMLARAEQIPGLIAYHDVQFTNGQWGNLVLFEAATDTTPLRGERNHADAIRRAPAHYHSLRLHRGTLPTGPLGEQGIELVTTLYLDFGETPPWRAIRIA